MRRKEEEKEEEEEDVIYLLAIRERQRRHWADSVSFFSICPLPLHMQTPCVEITDW